MQYVGPIIAAIAPLITSLFVRPKNTNSQPQVVHHQDPALKRELEKMADQLKNNQAEMDKLRTQLEQAKKDKDTYEMQVADIKAELDKASNPQDYLVAKRKSFDRFLEKINNQMFQSKVFSDGKLNVGMFGVISAGKSMLINALFNESEKCETGKGETTQEIKAIGESHGVKLWDLPGNSINFSFLEFEHLCFLASLSKVCVITESGLHDPFYNELLRICKKLQLKVIIVITKMDQASEKERTSLPAIIRKEATEVGYGDAPLFSISAKDKLEGKITYDWGKFIEELTRK